MPVCSEATAGHGPNVKGAEESAQTKQYLSWHVEKSPPLLMDAADRFLLGVVVLFER